MELKFKQQAYQQEAAMAVVNCFDGQSKGIQKKTVGSIGYLPEQIFANQTVELPLSHISKNIRAIQQRHGLKTNEWVERQDKIPQFTVEMETGTGKTYVYTKTMYELNERYGWSKFIIIVPSIAIREGVHKSLEITAAHFQEIYGKKIRYSIYNTQNKSNIVNIKNFANSTHIELLIMNYQAFASKSKESRKIYQKLDSIQSQRPIDVIKRAKPILIIDEPQRFGKQAESSLQEFDPLFVLRYSATHKKEKEFNKIYRLDAIDAYNQKLVKKINVKGIEVVGNSGTNSYLFLDKINISTKRYPTANIELEIRQKTGIKKVIRNIKEKTDLFTLSDGLKQYKGFVVKEINGLSNKVTFTNGVEILVGQSIGDVDAKHIRRIQIRETIKSHLEKEQELFNRGIKVLSLFFIDKVANYRLYDESNNQVKGEYALIFEEEYQKAIAEQDRSNEAYNDYINTHHVGDIHKGYFSIDKKGKMVDAIKKTKKEKYESTDVSAYDLIMKNKERLLSFQEPTRFIFSHSALREGWDNPNVFQICTLKESQATESTVSKRQEIGRGLRICVNRDGERMDVSVLHGEFFDLNALTVIASESYDSFAQALQNEIIDSLSERSPALTSEAITHRILTNDSGEQFVFNAINATKLIIKFAGLGYIDDELMVTKKLLDAIDNDTVELPDSLRPFKANFYDLIKQIHSTAVYKSSSNAKADNIHKAVLKPNDNFAKKEFQELWNKIKVKTVYEVDFDSNELVEKSVTAIDNDLSVQKIMVHIAEGAQRKPINTASLKSGDSMVKFRNTVERTESLLGSVTYDLIAELTKETGLTRKTIVRILRALKPDTFNNFRVNPESFIKDVSTLINNEKAATLINNITYSKTDRTYSDEIFTINNFKGALSENILEVKKHVYDYVKTDSKTERAFAKDLENGEVLIYAKLPYGFKIPTPVGSYNPDWAIVFDTAKFKYVYFIAETKGSMDSLQLKEIEKRKINYAKKHFNSLGHADLKYDMISNYNDLMDKVMR